MATENIHDRARFQICRWCCVKVGHRGRITALTGQTRNQYIEHFEPIDDSDYYRPLVVCTACKIYLAKASRGSPPKKVPSRFPWPARTATRTNDCSALKNGNGVGKMCLMCTVWFKENAALLIRHARVGRPRDSSTAGILTNANKVMYLIRLL